MFSEMLTSSVWLTTNKDTKLLWMTLLMAADKNGIVSTGMVGLASMATLSYEEAEKAMEVLMSPDPRSKTPDMEGRRVIKIDGGTWQIVNYVKYRDKWVGAMKQVDAAKRQRNFRLRKKIGAPPPPRGRPPSAAKPETEQPEY